MAVYGNIVSSNDRLFNTDYIIKESNELIRISEAIVVINESCIITEKVDLKAIKERIIKFFKDLKDKFVDLIKRLSEKIKEFSRKFTKSTKIYADLYAVDCDYYGDKYNDHWNKYAPNSILDKVTYNQTEEDAIEKVNEAIRDLSKIYDEFKDGPDSESVKKENLKGETVGYILDNAYGAVDGCEAVINNVDGISTKINSIPEGKASDEVIKVISTLTKYYSLVSSYFSKLIQLVYDRAHIVREYMNKHNIKDPNDYDEPSED